MTTFIDTVALILTFVNSVMCIYFFLVLRSRPDKPDYKKVANIALALLKNAKEVDKNLNSLREDLGGLNGRIVSVYNEVGEIKARKRGRPPVQKKEEIV